MMMMKNSMMDPPPVELRNRLQDGISREQKVTAVELGFLSFADGFGVCRLI